MQIPVLIERVAGNGYRARGAEPLGLCAEGATRNEALAKLRELCEAKAQAGAEWIALEMGVPPHPWLPFAGMFKDDPLIAQWKQSVGEYREQIESDAGAP